MSIRVTRDRAGGDDHNPTDAVVFADDEGGDQMIVSAQAFTEFVARVKAGEFDQQFDPATGRFHTR